MRRTVPALMTIALVPAAWGQQAVSARAGLIQYVEGRVLLNDKQIAPKVNEFVQVEKGQTLATGEGRAEVLLTPGAFLRLSENSSFRMISGSLSDTRLEVLSGSAMVEVEELLKDNAITLQSGATEIALKKHGLYRIDADGGSVFRVYDGEAAVTLGDQIVNAKRGRQVEVAETLLTSKFDTDITDPFYRWSERRAGYVATANVASARSVGGGRSLLSSSNGLSNWTYNPWFGMYTFVPLTGFGYSPFGYAIYSPLTVQYVTLPANSIATLAPQRTITPPSQRAAAEGAAARSNPGAGFGAGGASGRSTGDSGGGSVGTAAVSSGGGGGASAGAATARSAPAASAAPASAGGGARGR
jgi:hypothetical protein